MIREKVKMNMDIISAFAEGKTIQYKTVTGVWCDLTESEGLPMGTLEEEPNNFRIKPDSKPESKTDVNYRPFANGEECWVEMQKHQPFGWVINKSNGRAYNIQSVLLEDGVVYIRGSYVELEKAFIGYTFVDGTPFGVKTEE